MYTYLYICPHKEQTHRALTWTQRAMAYPTSSFGWAGSLLEGRFARFRADAGLIHPAWPVVFSESQPCQMLAYPHTPLILSHSLLTRSAWSSLVIPYTHMVIRCRASSWKTSEGVLTMRHDSWQWSGSWHGQKVYWPAPTYLQMDSYIPLHPLFPIFFLPKSHKYFPFPHLCLLLETCLNKFFVIAIYSFTILYPIPLSRKFLSF